MMAVILKDILTAGYQYRVQALIFGGIGFVSYGIWKTIDFAVNKQWIGKNRHLFRCILQRSLLFGVFCAYLAYAIAVTLSGRETGSRIGYINAGIFQTLLSDEANRTAAIENFLLFLPLGILLPIFCRKARTWKRMGFFALCFSFSIEFTQLKTGRGYFQIDDILLNVLGALCGFFLYKVFGFLIKSCL